MSFTFGKNMNRDPKFLRAFVAEAKRLFSTYEDISHTWVIGDDEDECTLLVPKSSDQGFDVFFDLCAEEVVVYCGAFHEHYPVEGDVEEFAAHCVGMLYDLLSPIMRLKEYKAGETPYKWTLEMDQGGKWQAEGTTALLFYNYLAKRNESILQNRHLAPRQY